MVATLVKRSREIRNVNDDITKQKNLSTARFNCSDRPFFLLPNNEPVLKLQSTTQDLIGRRVQTCCLQWIFAYVVT